MVVLAFFDKQSKKNFPESRTVDFRTDLREGLSVDFRVLITSFERQNLEARFQNKTI